MSRLSALPLIALLLAFSGAADACRTIAPDLQDSGRYSAIFVGPVTGIRLHGFERALVGTPDATFDGEGFTITDGSSEVRVTTVPAYVASGSADGVVSVRLVGCTTSLPALRENGLFFLSPDRTSAVTVWESSGSSFTDALRKLGVPGDAF